MTNMNVNNPPVIDEYQVIKTWPFLQNADGSLSPAPAGGGGGGGVVTQGTVPWVISGADGDVFVRSNAAATFPVTATQGPASATPWNENVAQWGGAAVAAAANTSPVGTEVLPSVRNIQRRYSQILTTANLNANASYTSGWFDTLQTGDMFITATAQVTGLSNSAQNGFYIEEANDTSLVLPVKVAAMTASSPGTNVITGGVRARYWRVNYTQESAGATTTFELSYCAYAAFAPATISNTAGNSGIQLVQQQFGQPNLGGGDGQTTPPQAVVYSNGLAFGTLFSSTLGWIYNGASFDKIRTPKIFNTKSSATALGDTAVWTPASGKKFRVMRFQISVQGLSTTAAGGNVAITLRDATTAILHTFNINVPASALTGAALLYESNWIDLGNGYLSAAANNVLNVNLGTAFTAGGVDVFVIGTEE